MSLNKVNEEMVSKVISLVVAQADYGKIFSEFAVAKLWLASSEKKTLRSYVDLSRIENFLDLTHFSTFLNSIDFDSARTRSQERKAMMLHRKKKQRAKGKNRLRKGKGYQAPKRPKVTAEEILANNKDRIKIGLGLESIISIKRIKANEVVLDKNTDKLNIKDKSILYAAGWSIKGAFTKN
jgi:hypothetical protein